MTLWVTFDIQSREVEQDANKGLDRRFDLGNNRAGSGQLLGWCYDGRHVYQGCPADLTKKLPKLPSTWPDRTDVFSQL